MAGHTPVTGGHVKIGTLEMKIARVEGFRVRVMWDSRNVGSDREGMPPWPYEIAARDSWTVAKWRQERFVNLYPGFDVGRILLETLRESYD